MNAPGSSAEELASGQRLVILAVVLNFAAVLLRFAIGDLAAVVAVAAVVSAIVGLVKVGSGFGYSVGLRVLLIILILIPLVGLVTLLVLNAKVTRALKAAGYEVGLLGARTRD